MMVTLKIFLNDKEFNFESENGSIAQLLEKLNVQKEFVAVCINGDIIKKKLFNEYILKNGDRVDIITMVGGG